MANFNININAQVEDNYTVNNTILLAEQDCNLITKDIGMGVIETTSNDAIKYFLLDYTRANPWKTLKLTNITYSKGTEFYLADAGGKIPAGSYDLDVTGIAGSAAIPNFVIRMDNLNLTANQTITFDVAVEDTNLDVGSAYSVTIFLQRERCPAQPAVNYLITGVIVGPCDTTTDIDIAVPDEEVRRVVITESGDTGYSDPITDQVITTPTVFNLVIAGSNTTTPLTTNLLVEIYPDAISTTTLDSFLMTRKHNGIAC